MDVVLPERITKRIANQARLVVASYINYCYRGDKPTDSEAEIACYESVVHDLVEQFRQPFRSDETRTPNREQELLKRLKERYGNDVSYEAKDRYSSRKIIWVQLGMGAQIGLYWQEYQGDFRQAQGDVLSFAQGF